MSDKITCRACSKSFPRPQRRGRPPVECDTCRGKGIKAPTLPKPSEARSASAGTGTLTKAVSSPSVDLRPEKKGSYRSGFCGVTRMADGHHQPNPQHIHKLCRGGICSCGCHKGEDVWS